MNNILKIALAVLFFVCLLDMPYGYFQFVRFVALIGFAILAYKANEQGRKTETIIYVCLAILFQPLIKIALGRAIWNVVDVIVGFGLLVSIFIKSKISVKKTKTNLNIMKKYLFLVLINLTLGNIVYAQEFFHYDDPTFSFSIPSGWREYKNNPTLLMYGKFVKNKDGRIGGILRVGHDIYTNNISTIWNLNQDDEKRNLEKEAVLRNYSFKKETLNGNKVVKLNFETTIGEGEKRKDFKAVIYKYLVIQNKKEHVIFFFLITDPSDFDADNKDLLKIIASITFSSNKTGKR